MAEMDQGIKRLIQTHPADVLSLALPGAEYLGTLPTDVAAEPQLVLDTLLRVRYQGVECAVDLEAEARPQRDIGRRLLDYGARAMKATALPVISVVMWLEASGSPPRSPYQVWVGDYHVADWHFIGIEVYNHTAETLLDQGFPGLLPLIPFTRGGTNLDLIERTATLVQERASADEVETLESLLMVFAARTFEASVLLAIMRRLHMSTEIIEKSAFYQEALAKGREQGIEQGIEQGEERGLRDAFELALHGRFAAIPPEMTQIIARATADTLRELLSHVAIESLEQLRARLEA